MEELKIPHVWEKTCLRGREAVGQNPALSRISESFFILHPKLGSEQLCSSKTESIFHHSSKLH